MNSLTELKQLFASKGLTQIVSQGWYIVCYRDRWTMLDGVYYLNSVPVSKKEIDEYIKNPPKNKMCSLKMMRAKDYFEQEEVYDECDSIKVDVE